MGNIGAKARADLLKGFVIVAKEGIGRLLAVLFDVMHQRTVDFPTGPVKDQKLRVGCPGGGGEGKSGNGAGKGETVIDGDVEIEGENWKFTGMTFTGNVKIRGNNIDISDCEVFGRVDVRGMGNKTP